MIKLEFKVVHAAFDHIKKFKKDYIRTERSRDSKEVLIANDELNTLAPLSPIELNY
jgi:hypothetical protein